MLTGESVDLSEPQTGDDGVGVEGGRAGVEGDLSALCACTLQWLRGLAPPGANSAIPGREQRERKSVRTQKKLGPRRAGRQAGAKGMSQKCWGWITGSSASCSEMARPFVKYHF